MKKLDYLSFGVALAMSGLLISCDKEYDLSKDINTDMKVGNYFSVPVGKTTRVELSRIIKKSETIKPGSGDNSVYEVITSGTTSSSVDLTTVSVNITPTIGDYNIQIPNTLGAPSKLKSYVLTLNKLMIESDPYNVNAKLPKEVDKFFRANLGNATTYLTVKISEQNWPTGIEYIKLKHFKINFPQILNLTSGGNVFTCEELLFKSDTKSLTLPIPFSYLDIADSEQDSYIAGVQGNKYLKLNEKLQLSADIEVSINGIPQITSVPLSFEYKANGNVSIKEVSGVFHTDANINETIEINDIPDFLNNGNSSFTPNEVNFALTLENPINIPWNLTLGFMSMKNDGQKSDNVEVGINAKPGRNELLISNKSNANIVVPNLPSLFRFIPDKFEINSPEDIRLESGTHKQTVELGKNYTIKATYDVAIPFSFSKMKIEYIDDIDGLADDLFDVLDVVDTKEIYVKATAETTIPANLQASVKLFDRSGNDISDGIKVDLKDFIIKGAENNEVKESPVTIKLTQVKDGYLKRLDRIEYTVNADNANSNMSLRSDQYIVVKNINVVIPNGIKLTL